MVILITGKAGAGKTEYASRMANELHAEGVKVAVLDGDEYRAQTNNRDYDDDGRERNLMGAAEVAADLERQGHVVLLSFIAPRRAWRDMMRTLWRRSRVVYVPGGKLWVGSEYERPTDEELQIRSNNGTNDSN